MADKRENAPAAGRPAARERWLAGVDVPITAVAGGLTVAFLATGLVFTDQMRVLGLHAYNFIASWFGWAFVLGTAFFVFFFLALGIGRTGRIRLGAPEDRPEHSTFSWIAMMFALGVGIGLIFYGVAEPVILYAEPPPGGPQPRTEQAAIVGMQYSIFHWALHPWAFFGITGLVLAYSTHKKGRNALVTSALRPLIGRHADGGVGRAVNAWVIVTTLVGNAVTLGLGTLQIIAGLDFIWGLESTTWLLLVVVGTLTVAFLVSAVAGVDRGIKRLADFNVVLAIGLMIFLVVLGPLRFILNLLTEALGGYVFNFIPMSFQTGTFAEGTWMQNWTIFFWAWGISWAPYVGVFLAKISRGRTIREYVLGVLVAPSVATIVWFSIFGGTALNLQLSGTRDIATAAAQSAQAAMFELLETFPLTVFTSLAVVILAAVFFVSGADAGAIVLGAFSSWGDLEPKKWLTAAWGSLVGGVALVLLIVGGLDALQWGAIVVSSPAILVVLALCVALMIDLRTDIKRGAVLRRGRAPATTVTE